MLYALTFPVHRRLAWTVMLLLLFGHVILFSATGVMGLQRYGSEFHYVIRQAICSAVGLAAMVLIARVPHSTWRKIALPGILGQIAIVALTLFSPFAHHAQGASRWLRIGEVAFQPSELSRITVALYVAHLLTLRQEGKIRWKHVPVRLLPVVALFALLLRQPDMGTTIQLTLVTASLLFLAGIRLRYFAGAAALGGLAVMYLTLTSDYRRRRLFAFLNPWADPQGSGFQTIQSFMSFLSGKIFGVGLGNGNSKLFFLPEVHTDFIFALVGEELGFVGAIGLCFAFFYLCYLVCLAPSRAKDIFGSYFAFGLALSIVLPILVNLGGVTGLLPVKGLPLPFISWGRSALLVNLLITGLLLSILRGPVTTPSDTREA